MERVLLLCIASERASSILCINIYIVPSTIYIYIYCKMYTTMLHTTGSHIYTIALGHPSICKVLTSYLLSIECRPYQLLDGTRRVALSYINTYLHIFLLSYHTHKIRLTIWLDVEPERAWLVKITSLLDKISLAQFDRKFERARLAR